jgi:hypothetical protein
VYAKKGLPSRNDKDKASIKQVQSVVEANLSTSTSDDAAM